VEAKQAEQCELDGPDAPTLPPLTWPVAHALLDCKCPSAAIRHHQLVRAVNGAPKPLAAQPTPRAAPVMRVAA
jgi:hypothetical protein